MSAIAISSVARLRMIEEANGSFEVDQSVGAINSFTDMPVREDSFSATIDQPTESVMHVQQHLDGYDKKVLMVKKASMKLALNLETLDTKAGNATQAARGALGLLLKATMGGETLGTGTTVATTNTTTVVNCTSAAGIAVGSAIACATGVGGTLEMREVKSKSSNAVTVKYAFSSAPQSGQTIFSCATYSMGGTLGDQTTSLQAILEGLSPQHRYLLRGGQLQSLAFNNLAPGALPTLSFDLAFTKWDYANGTDDGGVAIIDLSGSTLGLSSYSNVRPNVVFNSELRAFRVGDSTITNTLLHAPKFDFKPNIKYTSHKTPSTRSTYKQWIRDRSAPLITHSFSLPEQDKTWLTAMQNSTSYGFALQLGSSPTVGGILITMPTAQIDNVQPAPVDNIHGINVNAVGRLDEDTSGSTTDLARSTFRIHLF